jgi:hypothetical protein
MSRRHHGGRPHRANGPGRPLDSSRPIGPTVQPEHQPPGNPDVSGSEQAVDARGPIAPIALPGERLRAVAAIALDTAPSTPPARQVTAPMPIAPPAGVAAPPDGEDLRQIDGPDGSSAAGNDPPGATSAPDPAPDRRAGPNGSRPPSGPPLGLGGACTAPQLRRFIKSRPYVPMHELRRRFGIDGGEDDVTSVDLASGRIYVGLPSREGSLLGELLRGGEVGFELSLDPRSPVVVGLYPMRPVARS